MNKLGMIRVAAASPKLLVGNPKYNVEEMIRCAREAQSKGAAITLFPELAVTGSTCGDLFHQEILYEKNLEGLKALADSTKGASAVVIAGCYLKLQNVLYDCAALMQDGKVRGIVPKMFPSGRRGRPDRRWFGSGAAISKAVTDIKLFGYDIPFGNLIFSDDESGVTLGIEVGSDLYAPVSFGAQLALRGAHLLCIPAADNETVGSADSRRQWLCQSSAAHHSAYLYASAGMNESTTDLIYGGDCMIAENGTLLSRSQRYDRDSHLLYNDIDYGFIARERTLCWDSENCAGGCGDDFLVQTIPLAALPVIDHKKDAPVRRWTKNPFICDDPQGFQTQCRDIFDIQVHALMRRLEHTHSKAAVLGISGGLDSTLALLVTAQAFRTLRRDPKDIIAVTMPGFGTTDKTYQNALTIMKTLGTTVKEISIVPAVTQHLKDIGHDLSDHDVTYENAQARERTQILMDIANQFGGLVVGTGDLSEAALGWCTYNGDHISMYNVNCGVPKTLIPFVIQWLIQYRLSGAEADLQFSSDNDLLKQALVDIMDTPISPELLPPDETGRIAQKTEEKVGPYLLHDFFLYHTIRRGATPAKMVFLAKEAFRGDYSEEEIKKWLAVFYRRFFSQQFKRNCVPDGPKVGSVGLSPRGDWSMPSDADVTLWLSELK